MRHGVEAMIIVKSARRYGIAVLVMNRSHILLEVGKIGMPVKKTLMAEGVRSGVNAMKIA